MAEYTPTLAAMLEGLVYSQLELGKQRHADPDLITAESELRRQWAEALAAHDAEVRADERAEAHAMHMAYRPEVVAEVAVAVHEECAWEEIAKWCGGTVQSGPDGTDSGEHISWIDIPGVGQAHDRMWIVQRHDLSFDLRWEVEGPSEQSVETIRAEERAKIEEKRRGEHAAASAQRVPPIVEMADGYAGSTKLDRLAIELMRVWGRADKTSSVSQHPLGYVATFADMARAVLDWPELADERAKRLDREQMIYRARATEGEVVGPERTSPEMAKEAYWQALALHPFDMEDETPLVEIRPQVPWQPLALEPAARTVITPLTEITPGLLRSVALDRKGLTEHYGPTPEAREVTDAQANTARRVLDTHYLIPADGPDPDPGEVHCHCGLKFAATSAGWKEFHLHGPRAALEAGGEVSRG